MNAATISKVFTTLRSCGVRGGPTSPEEEAVAMLAWMAVLQEVDDSALESATLARLAGSRSPWWPTPGEMLALCPRPATRLLEAKDEGFDFETMMARLDGRVTRLVDLGLDESHAREAVSWDEFAPSSPLWAQAREQFLEPYRAVLEAE